MKRVLRSLFVVGFIFMTAIWSPARAQNVSIAIGTVAPEGSLWHEVLVKMKQGWSKASDGKVTLRIFPGGTQGDEGDMLRKTRIGQLQGVALSGAGLSQLDTSVSSLQIPMSLDSYQQLDYVRAKIEPKLERAIEAKDFIVLNWSDVGWVHFFSKKQIRTPDELKSLRLFTSAGDPDTEAMYKEFGFRPVPTAVTDLLTSLQSGRIEALDVPPLFAMADQSFGTAKFMIDLKWAPLIGATIISRSAWLKVPENLRPELMKIARKTGDEYRTRIRAMGDEAVTEMVKKGLTVTRLNAAEIASWRAAAESAYPKMRGKLVPADLFDEVIKLSKEFRP